MAVLKQIFAHHRITRVLYKFDAKQLNKEQQWNDQINVVHMQATRFFYMLSSTPMQTPHFYPFEVFQNNIIFDLRLQHSLELGEFMYLRLLHKLEFII